MTIAQDYPFVAARPRQPASGRWGSPGRVLYLMRLLLGHRIVQFGLLGGLIFALSPRTKSVSTIAVRSERLAALRAAEASRPSSQSSTATQAREIDQRALEDEILYREGLRLGLDKNDGIVRQRVVQMVLFLAEELAGASRPADESSLRAFFAANQQRWAIAGKTHFIQIYRHQRAELAAWVEGNQRGQPPMGEPCPAGAEIDADREQIAKSLGVDFATALDGMPVARWSGPIRSAFGWHAVKVIERHAPRLAGLNEVRGAVVEAFSVYRRQQATSAFLEHAFARYKVTLDDKPFSNFTPSQRIAFRAVSSGED